MPDFRVQIVRFVSEDPQPGVVEAQFHDAQGKLHSIIDKIPLFTTAHLWSDSNYPQPGFVQCRVLETIPKPTGDLARINVGAYHFEWNNESAEFLVPKTDLCEMAPFTYGGFWDVPRHIMLCYQGKWFLLQSTFDESMDDYTADYSIYIVPVPAEGSIPVLSPEFLNNTPMECVGQFPIGQVTFDSTRRKLLDASFLVRFV